MNIHTVTLATVNEFLNVLLPVLVGFGIVNNPMTGVGMGPLVDNESFSAPEREGMKSTSQQLLSRWNQIPEESRGQAAAYIISGVGITDQNRKQMMAAFENASTADKLEIYDYALQANGVTADTKRMESILKSQKDYNAALLEKIGKETSPENPNNKNRLNMQKALVDAATQQQKVDAYVKDWAKNHYSFGDAVVEELTRSAAGWTQNPIDAIHMGATDLLRAGQQKTVTDGVKAPWAGVKDSDSVFMGITTVVKNVLYGVFRTVGLPVSLFSKAILDKDSAEWLTDFLMNATSGYHDAMYAQQLKLEGANLSHGERKTVEIAGMIADQVPSIALAALGAPNAGLGVMGTQAAGQSARYAYENGATLEEAISYGLLSGLGETATEKLFTGFGWFGRGVVSSATKRVGGDLIYSQTKEMLKKSDFANSMTANILKRVIAGGGEATEEMIMELVTPYLERATFNLDAEAATMEEIVDAGLMGFVVAELLGLPATALGVYDAGQHKKQKRYKEDLMAAVKANGKEKAKALDEAVRAGQMTREEADVRVAEIEQSVQYSISQLSGEGTLEQKTELPREEKRISTDMPVGKTMSEAVAEMRAVAKHKKQGETVSAAVVDDNGVKVYEALVTSDGIGLMTEQKWPNINPKALTAKARAVSAAGNETRRSGLQYNAKEEVIREAENLSQKTGRKVRFVSVDPQEFNGRAYYVNGSYDGDTILINVQSGNPTVQIQAHELTHSLEKTKEWQGFRDFVLDYYKNSSEQSFQKLYLTYDRAGKLKGKSAEGRKDAVERELIADFVEKKIFTDKETARRLVEHHRNWAEKIADKLNDRIQKTVGNKEEKFLVDARNMFREMLRSGVKETAENKKSSGEEVYSVNDAFSEDVQDWYDHGKADGEVFILGSTGDVLQGLGAIESDIYMRSEKINAILSKHPEMTITEIKRLAEIVDDPVLVLRSKNVGRKHKANTRLVIFGSVRATNGKPVLSILELKPSENNLVISDMQKISSAYTKTLNPEDFVMSSEILYADKKRTIPLLRAIGFKMPIALARTGSIGSIFYHRDIVNMQGVPASEVFLNDIGENKKSSGEEEVRSSINKNIFHMLLPCNYENMGRSTLPKNYTIVESGNQLNVFMEEAFAHPQSKKILALGVIPDSVINRIKSEIQDIKSEKLNDLFVGRKYILCVSQDSIRHLIDSKSRMTVEDTFEYISKLPSLITDFDSVRYVEKPVKGMIEKGLRFKKVFSDGEYISVTLLSKHGFMSLKTMFLNKEQYENKKSLNTSLPDVASPGGTSETHNDRSSSTNSISETGKKSNSSEQYSIAGPKAKTANVGTLEDAKNLLESETDMKDIYRKTGWYIGADGKWRFEIDDNAMEFFRNGDALFAREHAEYARWDELYQKLLYGKLSDEEEAELRELDSVWGREKQRLSERAKTGGATLENMIRFDALFEAYPEMRNVQVVMDEDDDTNGRYLPDLNVIHLNTSAKDKKRTLLHEIQHAIQKIEGFAKGSNEVYWAYRDSDGSISKKWKAKEKEILRGLSPEDRNKYIRYQELDRVLGELLFDEKSANDYEKFEAQQDKLYEELYPNKWFRNLLDIERELSGGLYHDLYRNTAGEIEARDVEKRHGYSDEQRKDTMPDTGDENTVFAEEYVVSDLIKRDITGEYFVDVLTDILENTQVSDISTVLNEVVDFKFPSWIDVKGQKIGVSRRTTNEWQRSKNATYLKKKNISLYEDKMRAFDNADELLKTSKNYVNEEKNILEKIISKSLQEVL